MNGPSPNAKAPAPREGERPTSYADRVGRWYAAWVSVERKKGLGQYLTPVEVAGFMARLCKPVGCSVRVLDPGAGAGILSCALCEQGLWQRFISIFRHPHPKPSRIHPQESHVRRLAL